MPERISGTEALEILPFTEVVFPFNKALNLLDERTIAAMKKNMDTVLESIPKDESYGQFRKELFERRRTIRQWAGRGGFSFEERELRHVYKDYGKETYKKILDYYVQNGFKTIFSRQVEAGNPGNIAMGYVLDLMDIVKPAVATFDQRTAVVIRSFREGGISPLLIGAMVDDAFHKRGTARLPFDFFMDKKRLNSSLLPIWVLLCLRKEYFLLKATQSR